MKVKLLVVSVALAAAGCATGPRTVPYADQPADNPECVYQVDMAMASVPNHHDLAENYEIMMKRRELIEQCNALKARGG